MRRRRRQKFETLLSKVYGIHLDIGMGVRRGVSKGVEDGQPSNGHDADSGMVCPQDLAQVKL
jgi:hypothetical protein